MHAELAKHNFLYLQQLFGLPATTLEDSPSNEELCHLQGHQLSKWY
jgi:hypothetical protein